MQVLFQAGKVVPYFTLAGHQLGGSVCCETGALLKSAKDPDKQTRTEEKHLSCPVCRAFARSMFWLNPTGP